MLIFYETVLKVNFLIKHCYMQIFYDTLLNEIFNLGFLFAGMILNMVWKWAAFSILIVAINA
jgi:hypothetical protein